MNAFGESFRPLFSTDVLDFGAQISDSSANQESEELLTTSELPLSEVGLESGIADQAAFSTAFKALDAMFFENVLLDPLTRKYGAF